jgi:DNA-3-methyladenine glycosylase II
VNLVEVADSFDLRQTCAPVYWGRGRWPNTDWIDNALIWVGWEDGRVVIRQVSAGDSVPTLMIVGTDNLEADSEWAERILGIRQIPPQFSDSLLRRLAQTLSGLRPHASGSLFEGLVDSIVGQSITVAAAAVVGARLASLFHPGIELRGRRFWPAPRADDLADAGVSTVRGTGVTWKRAEALVQIAKIAASGHLISDFEARTDPDQARKVLVELPLVGRWTAESALLWGLGAPDAFPVGDVALLRAARNAYQRSEMTMRELTELSESWNGARGWGARFLWTDLLGIGP